MCYPYKSYENKRRNVLQTLEMTENNRILKDIRKTKL